ncbi:WhiB family transcriptional regulator [Corynebacterium sp. A21]|uniref:WhiB family transcriptional regulator n=1 Tax=Corynebacterium sp. A21 TaxID=3457318 RepID=UPI003FD249A2
MLTSLYFDQPRSFPKGQKPAGTSSQVVPSEREVWISQARCRQGDPDALFVQGAQQRKATTVCRHCTVRNHCLATSLDNHEEFGVWGGLTERQRRALLRKSSHIKDWAGYLAAGGTLADI